MTAKEILKKLIIFETQLRNNEADFEQIEKTLCLLYGSDTKRNVSQYRKIVIPKLIPFFHLLVDSIQRKRSSNADFDDHNADLIVLYVLGEYDFGIGIELLSETMKINYKSNDSLWLTILYYLITTRFQAESITRHLAGVIPEGLIGIGYLQMANQLSLTDPLYCPHPFSTPQGVDFLKNTFIGDDPEKAVDAAVAIAFLPDSLRKQLLPLAFNHSDVTVRLEAAWAGTRAGDVQCESKLVEMTRDYRYAKRAIRYLEELGLHDIIPPESLEPRFYALAEMSSWLMCPLEFGALPTELSVVDSRTLYWPPTEDERTLTIIRYRFEKWNTDGSDEIGVGLAGSTTLCLGLTGLNERPSEEIYAIHCGWEMNLDSYENPEVGLAVLREYNSGFGT